MKLLKSFLLFVAIVIAPVNALASGRISVEPRYYLQTKEVGYMSGLSVYEKLPVLPVFLNSWIGTGMGPDADGALAGWAHGKINFDVPISKVTVSPGFGAYYYFGRRDFEQEIHVKLTYQLW